METATKLKIAAGVSVLLLTGCVVVGARKKKQDRQSALFFSELERHISPGSVGLVESDAFNILYWKDLMKKLKKSYYTLKMEGAKAYAKEIDDSWGGILNDKEDKVYGVFRALKDHVAVSQVADQYYQKKKINLIDDLVARMSGDEVGQILKIVNKMPPYRLGEVAKK